MTTVHPKQVSEKKITKRYILKRQRLFALVDKVKLWPSRTGILHGVKSVTQKGDQIDIVTHCGEEFTAWDSKNSRSARWLRNQLHSRVCPSCGIPQWKLEKYSQTEFSSTKKPDKRG